MWFCLMLKRGEVYTGQTMFIFVENRRGINEFLASKTGALKSVSCRMIGDARVYNNGIRSITFTLGSGTVSAARVQSGNED